MNIDTEPAIRFLLDGQEQSVAGVSPTRTLLQYLREDLGRHGTKEGCAEGDCGACTVVLGELRAGQLVYSSVNACIRMLATVHGCEVITVESLAATDGRLHPVQQAVVDAHASQCGFCTPGFVMSLFHSYLYHPVPTLTEIRIGLSGNLCRCTGYRPLLEAGCRLPEYPEPKRWSRAEAFAPTRREALARIQSSAMLDLHSPQGRFLAPRRLEDLAVLLEAHPDATLLAGGTDLGLHVTKQLREFSLLIQVTAIPELQCIEETPEGWRMGAAVRLEDAFRTLVSAYPQLQELWERFASPPIRHSGTLGGNIANGSPIGDSMPFLLALDAHVCLRKGERLRRLPLADFYRGYRQTALESAEFLQAIDIPRPWPGLRLAVYKIAKRWDQDISAICMAIALTVGPAAADAAETILLARIGLGGMAAIPQRAYRCEAYLQGQAWSMDTFTHAQSVLRGDFSPWSDLRASADYRQTVAGNLLLRYFLENTPVGTQSPGHEPVRIFDPCLLSAADPSPCAATPTMDPVLATDPAQETLPITSRHSPHA